MRTAVNPAANHTWLAWSAVFLTTAGVAGSLGLGTLWLLSQLQGNPTSFALVAGIVTLLLSLSVQLLVASSAGQLLREIVISIGAGVAVAALSQLIGASVSGAPLVAAAVVAATLAWSILAQGRRFASWLQTSFRVTPVVVAICAVLTVVPIVQVVLDLIVHPETASDLVNRRGGQGVTLVSVEGLALLVPFPAEAPPDAEPYATDAYSWFLLRDSARDQRIALIRTPIPADALRTRAIVVRVVDDEGPVDGALGAIAARDGTEPIIPVTARLLVEMTGRVDSIRDLSSLGDASAAAVGEVVRVRVRIDDGIASCVPRGDCAARRLAAGIGSWDNVASDPSGDAWAVVRTTYPPSVARFRGVGQMTRDRDLIARFLAQPGARSVLGWGRKLRTALVDHDPSLPVDHLWLGPILFVAAGVLLLIGQWIGYPLFRATGASGPSPPTTGAAVLRCRASGRITPPNASPHEIDERPTTLRADSTDGTRVGVELPVGRLEVTIPRLLGGLGSIEAGDLVLVSRSVPALKVDWYGTNLLLTFADRDTRDAAAALIGRG